MDKKNKQVPFRDDNYTHNIDRNNERKLDRRGFMKTLAGAAGVFAVSSLPWGAVAAKELFGPGHKEYQKQLIGAVSDIAVGDSVDFTFPTEHESAILIRLSEDKLVAYQNACTHLQCPVFWEKESGNMICPCHNGVFDPSNGAPTAGPPRRPLPEIALQVEEGNVYATGVKPYEA